ncbi:hypothetical protein BKA70DRAFT_1267067 [Coprinopsis sp. MPI-PUGE-AT-0042]|nr:hypothetical protein BKA70DRAFT_1267067 [Coprinopsis sp. MPI-PUGE-AT-0042]
MPPHPSLQTLDVASSTLSITSSGKDFGSWLQQYYPKVSKAKSFTRFREAMDRVYEVGDPDQEDFDDRPRFAPFIDLTTMVDRWNNVAYILRGSVVCT